MSDLLLMRHAEAVEGERDDATRGLTDDGRKDAKRVGRWLRKRGLEPDMILSSDFTRATETVERIMRGLKDSAIDWQQIPQLSPDATPQAAATAIEKRRDGAKLPLVVSHGPLIEDLLLYLTTGEEFGGAMGLHWKHGSVCLVHDGRLQWFITPAIAEKSDELLQASEAALALAENLAHASRARVVDPLTSKLQRVLARRFRLQAPSLQISEREAARWRTAYFDYTQAAYQGGAEIAAAELTGTPLREADAAAKRWPWLAGLLPWPRTAEDVEDQIDGTSLDRINEATMKATVAGLGVAAVAKLVADMFRDWASAGGRSGTIAETEIAQAFADGGRAAAREYRHREGVEVLKEWWAEDDACEVCLGNVDDGKIPEDMPFESGNFAPPAHVNCRCSAVYSTSRSEDETA